MNYLGNEEKKDRRKVIAVSTVIIAVVLILVASIIVVATKKTSPSAKIAETTEVVSTQENSEFVTENTESETNNVETTEVVMVATTEETADEAIPSASALPATGPEDFVPLGILLGSIVCYIASWGLFSLKSRRFFKNML